MVVENVFGHLKGRWRCLLKRVDYYDIQYSTDVVVACVTLHDVCELNNDNYDPDWIWLDNSARNHSIPPVTDAT